ncbi:RcnB family protein [Hyphomonas sp.]|uniref:RcnB family protein n=1 Tax=Hyphomonas sp. TaxID=87 RepID=UPI003918F4A0
MPFRKMTLILAATLGPGLLAYADPPPHARGHTLPPGLSKMGHVPPGQAKKIWGKGQYLPGEYRARHIENWRRHNLRQAPDGYRWVQVDRDAYLIEIASGLIAEALIGVLLN